MRADFKSKVFNFLKKFGVTIVIWRIPNRGTIHKMRKKKRKIKFLGEVC